LSIRNRMILEHSFLYFKRELPFDRFYLYSNNRPSPWKKFKNSILPTLNKIHGIPLGIDEDKYYDLKRNRRYQKDIDLFVSGEVSNTLREKANNLIISSNKLKKWNIVLKKSVPFKEYCELTARSKVTLSIAGSRWECFRHYEAVALGFDAVGWHEMPEEIFFENTFNNFENRLEELLSNNELREDCFKILEEKIENCMFHSHIIKNIVETTMRELKEVKK